MNEDLKTDTTIKTKTCDCPVCGAIIDKNLSIIKES